MSTKWLIVTGGAHRRGGQDRANLELIRHLAHRDDGAIHVVAHEVDPEVLSLPNVTVEVVPRVLGSTVIGELLLDRRASRVHARLGTAAVVVGNGGNYLRADVSWVHSVHTVWLVRDEGAPLPRRVFNRVKKWAARKREREAFRAASLLIANSAKTARDLANALKISAEKIVVVPFGADPQVAPGASARENAGHLRLAFVGALGWDQNKGLDIALKALKILTERGDKTAELTVAGPGSVAPWVRLARTLGLERRVQFLGMTDDVSGLLRNADLLVSPVRYEAYGLAIQEALVAGVPTLVTPSAGITPAIQFTLPQLVVSDHENPTAWANAIEGCARDLVALRRAVVALGARFSQRSWQQMAAEFVEKLEGRGLLDRR